MKDFFKSHGTKIVVGIICIATIAVIGIGIKAFLQKASLNDEILQAFNDEKELAGSILIHIKGAVAAPGVYEMPRGSRFADVIDAAGGLAENADEEKVNLAQYVEDGQEIIIPSLGEGEESSGLININTASKYELMELPGIGETFADRIIKHREEKGYFFSVNDLKKVSGMGEKRFEDIKHLITVE